jgi:hypothetical protein
MSDVQKWLLERDAELLQWLAHDFAPVSQTNRLLLIDIAARLNGVCASQKQTAALVAEKCAQVVEGNWLLSGSFGPLMNVGWDMANESGARAIRAQVRELYAKQEDNPTPDVTNGKPEGST